MLKPFHTKGKIEIGIDEAGRGCLMGPVCIAAVVLNPECEVSPPYVLKDSKKGSEKKKHALRGDDIYQSIAAASILAKTYRDEYMKQLVNDNPILQEYEIEKNKGYGTKRHIEALQTHGVTEYHRKSFKPCQK